MPVQWYSEPQYWRAILTFTSIWKTVGYSTIVYLAAMTAVDPALYEAATIDGAGRVNQLWHITLPGLFPVIGIQLIFSLGNLVRDDFDQIYTMTGGGIPTSSKRRKSSERSFSRRSAPYPPTPPPLRWD